MPLPTDTLIDWPTGFEPQHSPIYETNVIDIAADPTVVWELLVHPYQWSDYFTHAEVPTIDAGSTLELGTTFVMRAAGAELSCSVREFVTGHRLSWRAVYDDTSAAYHGWVITPTATGSRVRTEETQHGPFWLNLAQAHPGSLYQANQDWIEGLAARAQSLAQRSHGGRA